ncbi:MAG: hypothetical protein Q4A11_05660 [Brachymonas sp.]|nr:hypothetical protein [Brachymonas sp.]
MEKAANKRQSKAIIDARLQQALMLASNIHGLPAAGYGQAMRVAAPKRKAAKGRVACGRFDQG